MRKLFPFILFLCIAMNLWAQNKIDQYEYWFDGDHESKTAQTISAGNDISLDTSINTGQLPAGLHTFHVRFQDNSGTWSSVSNQFFMKTVKSTISPIVKYEYWFDEDHESKTAQTISAENDISLNTSIKTGQLPAGLHTFHVRFQDNSGTWSSVSNQFFLKTVKSTISPIVKYEYWFDEDHESKTAQTISAENDISLNTSIKTGQLPAGLHTFHVRFQDNNGTWSATTNQFFIKTSTSLSDNKISSYRYWFDSDFDDKITTTVDPVNPLLLDNISIPTSSGEEISPDNYDLSVGTNNKLVVKYTQKMLFHIQFKDLTGQWSAVNTDTISVINSTTRVSCDTLVSNVPFEKALPQDDIIHFYLVEANSNDNLALKTSINLTIDLFDPSGNKIKTITKDESKTGNNISATQTGNYYILVHGFETDTTTTEESRGLYTITYMKQTGGVRPEDSDNDGYYNLTTFSNLVWIMGNDSCRAWNFELDNDIDASETETWNFGTGFCPLENYSGIFDGQSHQIKYLHYNWPDKNYIALFGQLNSDGIIRNLGLTHCDIEGKNYTAPFVGSNNGGTISNCYSTGSISGGENIGGLAGYNAGTIKFCYNSALVNGDNNIGGITGESNSASSISQCYNIGKIIGGNLNVGGIIGANNGTIVNCYNAASVIGAGEVAGISGRNYGSISYTYNRGYINGTGSYCGAINGYGGGSITNSYWDSETSGLTSSNGGTAKTTDEMKAQSTYSSWDFDTVWEILSTMNDGYPKLAWSGNTDRIKGYSPEKVANSGSATITFEGTGFDESTKVYLYRAGQDTLRADTIYTSDTECAVHFNFEGVALGSWNILVVCPDTTVVIENGLTVEEKKEGKLEIEILGADKFIKGRATTVTVRLINTGNTVIENPIIVVAIDSDDSDFSATSNSYVNEETQKNCETLSVDINALDLIKTENVIGHDNRECKKGIYIAPTIPSYGTSDIELTIKSKGNISVVAWKENSSKSETLDAINQEISNNNSSNDNSNCTAKSISCIISSVLALSGLSESSSLFKTASETILDQFNTQYEYLTGQEELMASLLKLAGGTAIGLGLILGVSDPFILAAELVSLISAGLSCYETLEECTKPYNASILNLDGVSSLDPNEKYGYRSPSGSTYFNKDKTNFTYIINFENKDSATAAAQEVWVTDTLDLNLFDIESFRAGYVKIGENIYSAPLNAQENKWTIDMRPDKDLITYVTLNLNKASGVANWKFRCVDPETMEAPEDAVSGFLPPNDSTGRGEGSLMFSINLKDSTIDDAILSNHATIVFDYNDPIVTPTWTNKKDIIAPVSYMNDPDIVSDNTAVLSWEGRDNEDGSGIYYYNIYARKGDNDYSSLLTKTSATSVDFSFEKEVEYSFYVEAVDSAGNEEVKETVPDVTLYEKDKFILLSDDSISVSNEEGSTATVFITSNASWSVTPDQDWIRVSPQSGIGDGTLTFTAIANPNITARTSFVIVSADGVDSQLITVIQEAGDPVLSVSPSSVSVSKEEGSTVTVSITSNTSWSVVPDQDWLSVIPQSGTGDGTLTFTATANPNITARTSSVIVSADGVDYQSITVIQEAGDPVLSVSPSSVSVSKEEGSTVTVSITSNTSWSVVPDQDWLSVIPQSGTGDGTLTVIAGANPNSTERTTTITISADGTVSQSVVVTQETGDQTSNGKVLIYPNPSSDGFYVKGVEGTVIFNLYDMSGKLCISRKLNSSETYISTNHLSRGIYIIHIRSITGIYLFNFKLIKE